MSLAELCACTKSSIRIRYCIAGLVKLIENDLTGRVLAVLNDDTHTVAVGLVADVGDTLYALFAAQSVDIFNQKALVDHVGAHIV